MKRKSSYTFFVFFILVLFPFLSSNAKDAETIRLCDCTVNSEVDSCQYIFKFDNAIKYHCMLLSDPDRLVIDLTQVELKATLPSCNKTWVKKLRSSDHDHEYLRLVYDLNQKVNYKTSLTDDEKTLKVVLSKPGSKPLLEKKAKKKLPDLSETEEKIKKEPIDALTETLDEVTSEPSPIKLSKNLNLNPKPALEEPVPSKDKNIVIVIDPGHGGKDPGATGLNGAVEKSVVLQISKQLQVMLNDEPGFCAVLTRSTDYYIPLRKRLAIARKNHADMFIAVHADAYHHSHATGASVYALSQRGATSEAARWLAEKENESELDGLSSELADRDAILRSVLIDLSQTHTIESSLQIGNTILSKLGGFARLHHPKVEQAAFVVLKSPDIPSVLVETGFLSNPLEEEKLIDATYQYQTAFAIKEGIKQYFKINSPNGTWFSSHKKKIYLATNDLKKTTKQKTAIPGERFEASH